MPEFWTINSEQTKDTFKAQVDRWFSEHKYLTFNVPRIGPDRSLDQNALLHVWLTEFAAFLTPCHAKEVTQGMIEGTKRTVKGLFYRETQNSWMVQKVWCPITHREKTDFTSSAKWKRSEAFEFLTWLQAYAATEHGCILESKGEFSKIQREQNQ